MEIKDVIKEAEKRIPANWKLQREKEKLIKDNEFLKEQLKYYDEIGEDERCKNIKQRINSNNLELYGLNYYNQNYLY